MKRETVPSEIPVSVRALRLAGLGLLGKVQKESARLFEALVEEGKKREAERGEAAPAPAPNALKALGDTLLEEAQELQERAEARVARFLNRLGIPSNDELQALSRRVDELEESLQELGVLRKPEPRARKTAGLRAVATA